jgi:hypothetical protein
MTRHEGILTQVRRLAETAKIVLVFDVFLLFALSFANAQNRTMGEIRGTVTDASDARVTGVEVTLTNVATGVVTQLTTNADGVYDAASVVPGIYAVKFAKEGFKTFTQDNVLLHAEVLSVNCTLTVGSTSDQVVVTADEIHVQTDTSEIRTDLSELVVQELPNFGGPQAEYNLWTVLPGIQPQGDIQGSGGGMVGGDVAAINGRAPGDQLFLIDGGNRTVSGEGPWIATVPMDEISTANYLLGTFDASYGHGGSIFNVTTKSGSNNFHGSLFEYVQNDYFDARNYFSPVVAPYRFNYYGGTFGGPIRKNKIFFFGGYSSDPTRTYSNSYFTWPTAAMMNGDFSQVPGLDAYGNSTGQPIPIFIPDTLSGSGGSATRQPLPGNKMTPNQISPVSAAYTKLLPLPTYNNPLMPGQSVAACTAAGGVLPVNCFINNLYFPIGSPGLFRTYDIKLDYDVRPQNRVESSFQYVQNQTIQNGTQPGYPYNSLPQKLEDFTGQISDAWTLSPRLINEARITVNRFDATEASPDVNTNENAELGLAGSEANMLEGISWGGQYGNWFANQWPESDARRVDSNYAASDTVTWLKGKHVLKFGGEFDLYYFSGFWNNPDATGFTGIATQNPNLANNSPSAGAPWTQGLGFADFLFGDAANWYSLVNPSTTQFIHSGSFFVQDDYKMKKNLTFNIGLRYEVTTAWGVRGQVVSTFDPSLWNPGGPVQVPGDPTPVNVAPGYGAMRFGASAVAAPHDLLFDPRLGVAYSPKDKWVFRGAFGIYHVWQNENIYGVTNGPSGISGFSKSGSVVSNTDVPAFNWTNGLPPYTPDSQAPNAYNLQGVLWTPHREPVAYTIQWMAGGQHEIGSFMVDIAYLGTKGVHSSFNVDQNQVPLSSLHYYTDTSVNMQPYRQWPQFGTITGNLMNGYSMYNALQVSVKRQYKSGLSVVANYAQSKTFDTGSYQASYAIPEYYQTSIPKDNYAVASTNVPYVINGGAVYPLPVGRGKTLLNRGGVTDAVIGGWQVSGIWNLHGGMPFTPVMANDISGDATFGDLSSQYPLMVGNPWKAGTVPGNPTCPAPTQIHTIENWFNSCAFVSPGYGAVGPAGVRNSLETPVYKNLDFAISKKWRLPMLGEGARLEFQGQASNVFNHTNLGFPNPNIGGGSAGLITSTSVSGYLGSRNLQLGLHFTF